MNQPNSLSRRGFLARSAAISSAITALGGVHSAQAAPTTTLQLGLIGCGGIMGHHVRGLVSRKVPVEVRWLCDVDASQIARHQTVLHGFQRARPHETSRYEEVLADRGVDAVIVATPHHWHAAISLQAIFAGKDVYIEKPISHVFNEGPIVIDAARKYQRVVQQGSQMRSSPVTKKAARLLQDGVIGDVKVARAWTAELRQIAKPIPDSKPPAGVDYDRWLGPAPSHQFNAQRFHSTWRMFRDYGNGEIGDDGIHDLDMAAWGLGVDSVPRQITARGSRMMLHGHASEYPDNMNVTYEYPDGRLLIYENYPFTGYGLHGFDNGNVFYGTEGYMVFSRRGAFSVFHGNKSVPGPTEGRELRGERGYAEHMEDFLDAVRNRRLETAAPPDVAHYSCALVHLGEIAFRTAGRLEFDARTQSFLGNEEANSMLTKEYRAPFGLPVSSL